MEDNQPSEYKGMSQEGEDAYNKRQNEPLFKSAKDMIPMKQVQEHYENLVCGYKGCQIIKRDKSFYCCIWHQAMQAVGTDFFWYWKLINDNELDRMTSHQHTLLEERRVYMTKWCDNYPRGATG
jgi:hypothetical protein